MPWLSSPTLSWQTIGLLIASNMFMAVAWLDCLWAGLCMVVALYFIFRSA